LSGLKVRSPVGIGTTQVISGIRRCFAVGVFLSAIGLTCTVSDVVSVVRAATPPASAISEDVRTAIAQMGNSLRAEQFSFVAHTLRVYAGPLGQPLHLAHSMKFIVRRPDRLLVDVTGDDGSVRLVYDGKQASLLGVESNKYTTIPVPDTIKGMMDTVADDLDVDFPLADLLSAAPDKSVLLGVTSGREVNSVTIDGVQCRHLLLTKSPGVEIGLWVEKNDRALPRRVIIAYRNMSGRPSVFADLSSWNFSVHPSDADSPTNTASLPCRVDCSRRTHSPGAGFLRLSV
jgi:hypothetical protein